MDKLIQNIADSALKSLANRISANHIKAGQKASGRTIRSLRIEPTPTGGRLMGRSPFGTLETGRKGGSIPRGLQSVIIQWAKDKNIHIEPIPYKRTPSNKWSPKYTPLERGYMAFGGAVAHNIAQRGTKLFQEGGREDIYSNEFARTIQEVRNELRSLFIVKIKTI